jgi:hypothetical protein
MGPCGRQQDATSGARHVSKQAKRCPKLAASASPGCTCDAHLPPPPTHTHAGNPHPPTLRPWLTLHKQVPRHNAGSRLTGRHQRDEEVLDVKRALALRGTVDGAGLAPDAGENAVCGAHRGEEKGGRLEQSCWPASRRQQQHSAGARGLARRPAPDGAQDDRAGGPRMQQRAGVL